MEKKKTKKSAVKKDLIGPDTTKISALNDSWRFTQCFFPTVARNIEPSVAFAEPKQLSPCRFKKVYGFFFSSLIYFIFTNDFWQLDLELLNNGIQIVVKERIQVLIEKKDSLFSS